MQSYSGSMTTQRLKDLPQILNRHWKLMLAVFLAVTVPVIAISLSRPSVYTASAKILIENSRRVNLELSGSLSEHMEKFAVPIERINSQAEILKSRQLIGEIPVALGMASTDSDIKALTDRLMRTIEIRVVPQSTMIEVNYSNKDPVLAANVVNTLVDLYKNYHLKMLEGDNVATFYRSQYNEVEAALKQDYENLKELRKKAGVLFDVSEEQKGINDQIHGLRLQLANHDIKAMEAEAFLKGLENELAKTPKTVKTLVEMAQNPDLLPLSQRLVTLESERNALETKYTAESREVKDKLEEIAVTKKRIKATPQLIEGKNAFSLNPQYQGLEDKIALARAGLIGTKNARDQIATEIAQNETRLANLHKYSYDLVVAENRLASHKKSLSEHIAKLRDADFVDSMNREAITTVNVVQTADTLLPDSRVLMISIAMAMLLGLMLACAIVILLERLRPVISDLEQVKDILKLPVLATISRR
ncbi:MAG: hypothetical protein LLG06_19035 [Desulfobacteraceae bacterium]|nr:hypothetical protein [Desulfobacteraceae bacterium]